MRKYWVEAIKLASYISDYILPRNVVFGDPLREPYLVIPWWWKEQDKPFLLGTRDTVQDVSLLDEIMARHLPVDKIVEVKERNFREYSILPYDVFDINLKFLEVHNELLENGLTVSFDLFPPTDKYISVLIDTRRGRELVVTDILDFENEWDMQEILEKVRMLKQGKLTPRQEELNFENVIKYLKDNEIEVGLVAEIYVDNKNVKWLYDIDILF